MNMRKSFIINLIAFGLLIATPQISNADPLDHWYLISPYPTMNPLYGVTYGNGIFVAVGDFGTIITSPDGANWTPQRAGISEHLRGVAFGNNIFVAVGFNGTILTSSDGMTWTKRNSWTTGILASVTYGNGIFVAVGESTIITSQDGMNWTIRAFVNGLIGVTYGNGTFVAVGYYSNIWQPQYSHAIVYTSTNGINWTEKIPGTVEPLYAVAYGNGTFVAVGFSGTIFTSPNGQAWTERDSQFTNNLYAITYGNSIFAAAGWNIILTSADGIIWKNSASLGQDILYGIAYGNGTFVAVGNYGAIYTSSDAVTWTNRKVEDFPFYSKIIYANGMYVVLGNYDIVTTSDFKTWTVRYPDNLKKDMAYGNGTFVAVGKYGRLLTSHDGILWTESDALKKMGINYNLLVTFGQGIFVALEQNEAGNCKMLTSQDGENWTIKYTFWIDIGICSLNYEDGIFVIWASNLKPSSWTNAILISFDAEGWTKIVPETQIEMEGLTYGNGIFAAVDRFGAIWTSPDGKTWARMNNIPGWIGGIGFGGGYFVAGGYNNNYEKTLIVSSTDGVNWTARYLGLGLNSWLTGTPIYVNSTFIISGHYGTGDQFVLQSDPVGGPEVISTPNIPSGPSNGLEKISYSFSTGGSSSNLDHPVQYFFNWGDGTDSGWLPVGTTSASKSWTSGGIYPVKVQARCANHTTVVSPWSQTLLVTIIKTSISVVSPNGGESLTAGSTQAIRWSYAGDPGFYVKIELLKAGVPVSTISYLSSIGSGGNGTYNWSIPSTQVSGSNYQIKVTSTTNGAYTDISDNNFTIVGPPPPTISVISPNGGDTFTASSTQTIRWSYGGNPGSFVKVELLKGGAVNRTIKSFTSKGSGGNGSCSWTIPSNQTTGSDYKIRITSTSNGSYTDTSDNNFTIVGPPPPTISVVSPNGGDSWTVGTTQTIRWTYTGNPGSYVKIELVKGGVVNRTIKSLTSKGTGGGGSCNWGIPSTQATGSDYKIKITSTSNGSYTDTSDNDFTIVK